MQYDEAERRMGGIPAEPRPAGHGLATQAAAEALRSLILEGEIKPGARLSERAVFARLEISRTPLREALKILCSEGLVTLEPNRGATVTRMSLDDLKSAFELLAALEGAAAEFACSRASEDEIDAISRLHDQMFAHYEAQDLANYFRLNKAIHLAIVDAGKNTAIARVYRSESARVDRFRYASNRDAATWARSIRQHEQILDALRQREGGLLKECLVSHRRSGFELARRQHEAETAGTTSSQARHNI